MPKFKKLIVTQGTYHTDLGVVDLPPERIKHWANQHTEMRKAGLLTPAPWFHDFQKAVPVRVGDAAESALRSSADNGGFWDKMWSELQTDGKLALWGEVDAPGDENDTSTPAGKVGKTVRECSIYAAKEYKDGLGRVWKDVPMHVALCTHPIQPGQRNFEAVKPEVGVALAMSMLGNASDPNLDPNKPPAYTQMKELLEKLKKVKKLALPEDTNEVNLAERLMLAVTQAEVSEADDLEGSTRKPPEGAKEENAPLVMALTKPQIAAIIAQKVVNPATGQPFTEAELTTPDVPAGDVAQTKQMNTILMSHLGNTKKDALKIRLTNLLARGLDADTANKILLPQIESVVMSFTPEGQALPLAIEQTLTMLESSLPARKNPLPNLFPLGNDVGGSLNALSMSLGIPLTEQQLPNPASVTDAQIKAATESLLSTL